MSRHRRRFWRFRRERAFISAGAGSTHATPAEDNAALENMVCLAMIGPPCSAARGPTHRFRGQHAPAYLSSSAIDEEPAPYRLQRRFIHMLYRDAATSAADRRSTLAMKIELAA